MTTKSMGVIMMLVVGIAMFLGWLWFAYFIPAIPVVPDLEATALTAMIEWQRLQLEYYQIQQEAVQILVVGVVIGLAAVIVPTLASWNRERFERYKESRETYTRASTGVLYLPQRLAGLEYSEAMKLISEVHEYKHIAEAYDELEDQLTRRSGEKTQSGWSDNMWSTLDAYSKIVSEDPDKWGNMERKDRLQVLESALSRLQTKIGTGYYT